MKKVLLFLCLLVTTQLKAEFTLTSPAFRDMCCFPSKFNLCTASRKGHIEMSNDVSPPLNWEGAPKGTKSFVLLVTDPDAINSPYFNLPNYNFKPDIPRVTVYQWVLVDIPATMSSIPEGAGSKGYVEGGKPVGKTPYGLTGMNIYTEATKSQYATRIEPDIVNPVNAQGVYGGYDGGCPPWNDAKPHHYTFTIYALDIANLDVPQSGMFKGEDVVKAMEGHILGKADLIALYSTNPLVVKNKRCPCQRSKDKSH